MISPQKDWCQSLLSLPVITPPKIQLRSRTLMRILACLLAVMLYLPAFAQNSPIPPTDNQPAQTEAPDSQGDPDENATQEPKEEGIDLGLSELIHTEELGNHWATSVEALLEEYNLSTSLVGQSLGTLGVALVFLILYYLLKKGIRKIVHQIKDSQHTTYIPYKRIQLYISLLNTTLFLMLSCLFIMILCGVWAEQPQQSFFYSKASAVFQFLATFTFLFILGAAVFESTSALVERFFDRWAESDSARVQTLLPIARNVINVALFILLGITLISELGINIMPLLAGAGVIGFAVGFGAQTMIKDLITGFIIILEDLVQVGDVVTVGGKSGIIEKITIRKIQLRSLEGIVFTVPYSEISIVENMTKEYSYYLFNVGIAYRESPDEVIEVLRSISSEMEQDTDYKDVILEPIEILGVDAFADSAIIVKARIKTAPIKQWMVGREFNRRMKYRFDEKGIEIPFPHQTVYFGEDKKGDAPAANIRLHDQAIEKDSANDDTATSINAKTEKKPTADGIKEDTDAEDDS